MPDEIKLGIAQHRGIRAQELLDNELLKQCFELLENETMERWKGANDPIVRENCWRTVKTLNVIRDLLKKFVVDGRIAASDLNRLSKEYK